MYTDAHYWVYVHSTYVYRYTYTLSFIVPIYTDAHYHVYTCTQWGACTQYLCIQIHIHIHTIVYSTYIYRCTLSCIQMHNCVNVHSTYIDRYTYTLWFIVPMHTDAHYRLYTCTQSGVCTQYLCIQMHTIVCLRVCMFTAQLVCACV